MDPSDILVNIAEAKCLTFTGDGDAMNDRFMVLDTWNTLHVFGNMTNSGTNGDNFIVRFKNGVVGNPTTLLVDGDITAFDLIPLFTLGNKFMKIDVGGGITGSSILLGDEATMFTGDG